MLVYVVISKNGVDSPQIEGVWSNKEEAEDWIKMMYMSLDDYNYQYLQYYIQEYSLK
jgi:hypothetical protein